MGGASTTAYTSGRVGESYSEGLKFKDGPLVLQWYSEASQQRKGDQHLRLREKKIHTSLIVRAPHHLEAGRGCPCHLELRNPPRWRGSEILKLLRLYDRATSGLRRRKVTVRTLGVDTSPRQF